jgi:hypothetical protein
VKRDSRNCGVTSFQWNSKRCPGPFSFFKNKR